MNNAYNITNGKISVIDENGIKKTGIAYDKSTKILEKQNNVETIRNNIKDNNKKIKYGKINITKDILLDVLFAIGTVGIILLPFYKEMLILYLLYAISGGVLVLENVQDILSVKYFKKLNGLLNKEKIKELEDIRRLEETKKPLVGVEEFDKVSTEKTDKINDFNTVYVDYNLNKNSYFRKFKNNRLTKYLLKHKYTEDQIERLYELLYSDFQSNMEENTKGFSKNLSKDKKH